MLFIGEFIELSILFTIRNEYGIKNKKMKQIALIAIMLVGGIILQAQNYFVSYAAMETETGSNIEKYTFYGLVSIDFNKASIEVDNSKALLFKYKGKWEKALDGPVDDYGVFSALYVQGNDTILMKYDAKKTFLLLLTPSSDPEMYADMYRLEIE